MHRESIKDSIIGTVLVFNTVFQIPPDMPLYQQMFAVGMVFWGLYEGFIWIERRKRHGKSI